MIPPSSSLPFKKYEETRPWGGFTEFTRNQPSTVKILTITPQESLSLQYHHHREEFWRILSGNGIVSIGDDKSPAIPGEEHFIPKETHHRLSAGTEALQVLEISFGTFDENDIIRVEDKYGRTA